MYMKDFETTLLVAHSLPYAMRIAGEWPWGWELIPEKDLKVKTLVLGSELMTEAMRNELYKVWGEDVEFDPEVRHERADGSRRVGRNAWSPRNTYQ